MEQPTCGKGLAEHSVIPGKLAELTAAVAENLEAHMKALDSQDPSSKKEHEAYVILVKEHREAAAELKATANRMAGYQDLAMGKHDESLMAGPRVRAAFEAYVRIKLELVALLQKTAEQDQKILAQMRGEQA
jgi:hypothetical protein